MQMEGSIKGGNFLVPGSHNFVGRVVAMPTYNNILANIVGVVRPRSDVNDSV